MLAERSVDQVILMLCWTCLPQDRALTHQSNFQEKEKQSPAVLDLSAQLVGLLMAPSCERDSSEGYMEAENCGS